VEVDGVEEWEVIYIYIREEEGFRKYKRSSSKV